MNRWYVGLARRRRWQPLFIRLNRIAQVGMNYWGVAEVESSGERLALSSASRTLAPDEAAVVFDVGANQGDFTSAVLEVFPANVQVFAFEPSTVAYRRLEQRFNNPEHAGRVHMERCALSDLSGSATLSTPAPGSPIATMHAATFIRHNRELVHEEVGLTTMDRYCEENGIGRVHYLKIDTEGHEWAVLKGARNMLTSGRINYIQFEFGECHLDSRVFFRDIFLELHAGYRIHRILPDGLWPLDVYEEELEVFRTANYLAVRRIDRVQP